jgi:hypothetical protein
MPAEQERAGAMLAVPAQWQTPDAVSGVRPHADGGGVLAHCDLPPGSAPIEMRLPWQGLQASVVK